MQKKTAAIASFGAALALVVTTAVPASANAVTGYRSCNNAQVVSLVSAVTASVGNAMSNHWYSASDLNYTRYGTGTFVTADQTRVGGQSYQIYSPYTLVTKYSQCAPHAN